MNQKIYHFFNYLHLRFSIVATSIVCFIFFLASTSLSYSAEVTLAWDANTESDLAGYKVYYKTGSSGEPYDGTGIDQGGSGINILLDSLATPGTPSFSLTGLQENEFYYFVVTAVNSSGLESGYSTEVMYESTSTVVTYAIISSSGPNGSITPLGTTTVTQGANQTYSISPDSNYHIKDVQVDGVSVGSVSEFIFSNVMSDHDIHATFEADQTIVTHTITASSEANGSISPAGLTDVVSGSDITFNIAPIANYHIEDVQVDGVSVGALSAYTFFNVTADHAITAIFDINTYIIAASSTPNGSISPTGSVPVVHGDSQTFTIIPEMGYQIGQLTVDGGIVAPTTSYSFTNVTSGHSISANFIPNTYTITASAGDNGSISPVGPLSVEHGSSQTFTIVAAPGYSIADVLVDGASMGAETSYSFTNIVADHSISAFFDLENQAPIADAGPDQCVESGMAVSLKGSNSIDLDDGIASFLWEQVSGPPVELVVETGEPDATFVAPEVESNGESLTFELTVTDYNGLQSTDTCIVNVSWVNIPPVSDSGAEQTVDERTTVTLDGSKSTDADDGIASYLWEQLNGIPISLSDPTAVRPSFISPDVGPDGSTLKFQLTVTDNGGLQATDTCIVNVSWVNIPPVSDSGAEQTVDEGTTVTLDGSKSTDADNGIALHLWKQVSGIPVTLSDTTAIQSSFTAPKEITKTESLEFNLTVEDGGGLQSSDSCVVSVTPVIQQQLSELTVSSISVKLDKKGRNHKAIADVTITSESGNSLEGASVIGNWAVNGNYLNTSSGSTNTEGKATLVSNPIKVKSGDIFSISISDIIKEGFLFNPINNFGPLTVP
jgi:hypothetical protein